MKSTRRTLRATACALISMLILSGCATLTSFNGRPKATPREIPQQTATIDPNKVACAVFEAIFWSPQDTDQTIKQIKTHNAAWVALCRKEK